MADKCQPIFNKAIKDAFGKDHVDYWVSCVMPEISNRPDVGWILLEKELDVFYIEYKSVDDGRLKFGGGDNEGGWRQGQIDYTVWHKKVRGQIPLLLGVMFYNMPVEKRVNKRAYIVPASVAIETVNLFDGVMKSMPYNNPRDKWLKEKGYYLENLWRDWRVPRVIGAWDIKSIILKAIHYERCH